MNKHIHIPKHQVRHLSKHIAGLCLAASMLITSSGALAQTPSPVSVSANSENTAQTTMPAAVSPVTDQLFRIQRKIDQAVLEKFDAAIKANPAISVLEFDGVTDFAGIDIDAIMGVHDRIKQYRLSTTARGLCVGSCALLFMTGYTRTVLPAANNRSTRVVLRPITNLYHEFLVEQTDTLIEEIITRSDGKVTKDFIRKIYLVRDDVASIMIQYLAGKSDIHVSFLERADEKSKPLEPSTAEGLGLKIGE
ncbi:hypothetical protein ACO0LM_23075 [Undibacterium sp. Di26W]|uniref:hypothetical protein n=1 Tax=Undibacterium sp. Di26W TaxID=3413035 RepID=UPI003BF3D45F